MGFDGQLAERQSQAAAELLFSFLGLAEFLEALLVPVSRNAWTVIAHGHTRIREVLFHGDPDLAIEVRELECVANEVIADTRDNMALIILLSLICLSLV